MTSLKVGTKELATYTYGTGNGLLATQKYGNGATVSFTYNEENQVEKITYPDGRSISYVYTPDGQVYRAKESGGSKTVDYVYAYDDNERLISSEKKVNGSTVLRTRQLFNDNDQLTHENWKMGTKTYYRVLTYNTSTDYSLATVAMPTNQTLTMGYDSLRRLTSVTGGLYNQTYTYRDRDATYTTTQVSRLGYTRSGATTLNFDYTYDTLGNIETYTAPGKSKITYTYDDQGQLTKAAGATTYTYTYDNVGNILTAFDGEDEHTYTYGDTNWGDLLTKFDGQSISYDNAGNPTSYYNGTRWSFGWSNGRSLTSASGGGKTLSFTYDLQDGTRSTKTVGTEVHNYIYAGSKLLRETYGNTKLDFIYDVNGRPYAMIVNETTTYYYITNLQGDVINVVNSSGTIVASYEYDPYGNVTGTGSMANTNPLRYRGYYYDAETKLYYLQSRYYDPAVGRFINADSYASTGQGIIGNNMFTYCLNNPASYGDPSGCWSTANGISNPNAMTYKGGKKSYHISDIERAEKEKKQAYNLFNDSEEAVIQAEHFAFYKGALVIKTELLDGSGFSFGIIMLGPNVNTSTVKHEYGHFVHLIIIGAESYLANVLVPSLYDYWSATPYAEYYSEPQEFIADFLGGVERTYRDEAYPYTISFDEAFIYFIYTLIS